jgi:hypothetical protein
MFDVAYRMPKRPSDHARRLPEDVDLAFAIALAKDPKQRFDSAAAFAMAFDTAAASKLDEKLRERARTLLEKHAWGSERAV